MIKYVLFDLDGTLTNPRVGITKSIQYALRAYGINVEDLDSLCKYIGPPLQESFQEYHGIPKEQIPGIIEKYREYFSVKGIYENEVFDGIVTCLTKLKEAGKELIVATSKPEVFAKQIIEHFSLSSYFREVCGSTLDGSRSTKEAVIRYALEKNKITELDKVVMIGDRLHDIEGAKAVGIKSVGVLFGYGSLAELKEYQADYIVEAVDDIYDTVIHL